MAKLFGTNGIRGIFGKDFTLEFVCDITLSIATYFKKGIVLVGYDGRNSSPIITKMVCAALNYAGLDCKNAGLVPTPALEYATKKLGYGGSIMVTASHNPPEYNGIKPVSSDGVEVSREDELEIEEIYFGEKFHPTQKKWGMTLRDNSIIQVYIDGINSQIDQSKIEPRKFKVVLDLGNGAQAVAAPEFCKQLGCEVITVNEKIDGNFPGRGSEPTPQNLQELSQTIIENGADLGVAFDGDGDRSLFCDNEGKVLTGDKSALVISKYLLEKNPMSKVVTCLNSGSSIEEVAAKTKSEVIRTRVGSVEVSRKMVPTSALIGFEENGGFMYGKHNQVRDGLMTLGLVLELLATSNETLSQLVGQLPSSFTAKDKISCSKDEAVKIIQTLKEEYPSSDTTEGIKINFDTKNWIMVRPSGTEPIVRIYVEADSQEKLDRFMSEYIQKIKSILDR